MYHLIAVAVGGAIGQSLRRLERAQAVRGDGHSWRLHDLFRRFARFAVLWERGAADLAIVYAVASVVISLLALFAGLWFVRSLG
jgi:fluoride ion exporter CrcB/FEX